MAIQPRARWYLTPCWFVAQPVAAVHWDVKGDWSIEQNTDGYLHIITGRLAQSVWTFHCDIITIMAITDRIRSAVQAFRTTSDSNLVHQRATYGGRGSGNLMSGGIVNPGTGMGTSLDKSQGSLLHAYPHILAVATGNSLQRIMGCKESN